jgi:hypothetical protein
MDNKKPNRLVAGGSLKQKICSFLNRFLAGATGIAPSASNFGGTDFQTILGLERL